MDNFETPQNQGKQLKRKADMEEQAEKKLRSESPESESAKEDITKGGAAREAIKASNPSKSRPDVMTARTAGQLRVTSAQKAGPRISTLQCPAQAGGSSRAPYARAGPARTGPRIATLQTLSKPGGSSVRPPPALPWARTEEPTARPLPNFFDGIPMESHWETATLNDLSRWIAR